MTPNQLKIMLRTAEMTFRSISEEIGDGSPAASFNIEVVVHRADGTRVFAHPYGTFGAEPEEAPVEETPTVPPAVRFERDVDI